MCDCKYEKPGLVNPRQLLAGDEVATDDAGARLRVVVNSDVNSEDVIWRRLCNDPGQTKSVHGWAVPAPNVALELGADTWTVAALPQVLARRLVRSA